MDKLTFTILLHELAGRLKRQGSFDSHALELSPVRVSAIGEAQMSAQTAQGR
jgi:hypothetical protein